MRIGLISDTHGYLDPKVFIFFRDCDEIWHAGDFGSEAVSLQLNEFKTLRGVYGNIDSQQIRLLHPDQLFFKAEELKVLMIHIGGTPGNYFPEARKSIELNRPDLFVCGHSHILKVMNDKKYHMLYMNPGAAGKHGFHQMRTLIRFKINLKKISDVEVIELGLRGKIETH